MSNRFSLISKPFFIYFLFISVKKLDCDTYLILIKPLWAQKLIKRMEKTLLTYLVDL